ncbi:MAG: flagellar basal-body MS-ring/collar protein FliF, partial [Pseudomonadota bacterium]
MATATATDLQTVESPEKPITALMKNAAVRQLIAMIAIAASVALGVAVILWTRAPTMGPLYVNLTDAQVSEVVAALQAAGIAHDIDSATGQITVEKSNVYETRMMLAGQGLPSSDEAGMEILSQEPQFGLSSLQERMRYEHAREIELSRSITTLKWVRAARVHIARANDSVFVRDRKPTTASVILDVATGQSLPQGHVEAIVHMVSSGILNLAPSDVTVVDQFGNL